MNKNSDKSKTKSLQDEILKLLRENNAILLAHNYQRPEIQDVADLCGDSLELSIKASKADADIIVFCGVHFMAETASILCPDKKVILPVPNAGCPMANMINAEQLRAKKKEMPGVTVISYVNTTAEVKAESDICCTSANAIKVAGSVDPNKAILMTPDKNLAQYTKHSINRDIQYWDGYCPVHNNLTLEQVRKVKNNHPEAVFLAHPECPPEVLAEAHEIRSTSGMIDYASKSTKKEFIIGTETGIIHPLTKKNPDKVFIPADPKMVCDDMKKTGLQDVIESLKNLKPEVTVPDEISSRARDAVTRMLAIPSDVMSDREIKK
ncbi:quinolinate synthase NadA [Thermodesulfobacteriota bacterium]